MFAISESWVWDFWIVDDGAVYHLFFLHAPKSLGDPELRHRHAGIGHAVSDDLVTWHRRADVLAKGARGEVDDTATWTGSVVRGDDGLWYLFYTGMSARPGGCRQVIAGATSPDLEAWTKLPGPLLQAEEPWYEVSDGSHADEAFRDPWVFRNAGNSGWQMLITGHAAVGPRLDRGIVGHASSRDLRTWTLEPPLSEPGQGFGQLEVMEVVELDGRWFLVFNCLAAYVPVERRLSTGGTWFAAADSKLGPYDIAGAHLLVDDRFYIARVIRTRHGRNVVMAFRNKGPSGGFVGELTDPVDVAVVDGVPRVVGPGADAWG